MSTSQQSRKILGIGCVSIFVAFGSFCGYLWYSSPVGRASTEMEKELTSLRLEGIPTNPLELRQSQAIDENLNAATDLNRAFELLHAWEKTPDGKLFVQSTSHSAGLAGIKPGELKNLVLSFDTQKQLIDVLHRAADKPLLDFHRQWEKVPLQLPELPAEKSCVQLLIVKARYQLSKGQVDDGLQTLAVASRLTHIIGQDPVLVGLLTECGLVSEICLTVGDVLHHQPLNPAVLNLCRKVLVLIGQRPDVRPSLKTEFVMGQVIASNLTNLVGTDWLGSDDMRRISRISRFGPAKAVYQLRYIQVFHDMYRQLAKRPNSVPWMLDTFLLGQQELENHNRNDWTYGLADILAPIFTGIGSAVGEAEAKVDVLRASIDIIEAKQRTGKYPEAVLQTTGYWVDPFTENPLTYRSTPTGFLIYSFGRNRKDDGGRPRPKKFTDENFDIPFRFPDES